VLEARGVALLTLAVLHPRGPPTWQGLLLRGGSVAPVGSRPSGSLLSESAPLAAPTALLVDFVQAAVRSYAEGIEEVGGRLDALEARSDAAPLGDLSELQRSLATLRKHIARLSLLVDELDGPIGTSFPGLAGELPPLRAEVAHLESFSMGQSQTVRDLVALRNAIESNRLAEAANELGRVSNRIAALANNSNVRMLGIAYLAFVLALVSAVVLIPNTAATILGMPSAGWVPGLWVDLILVVLAVVPIVVVFSRPWVLRLLHGAREYETRSAEGMADLPEVAPSAAARPAAGERIIRDPP